MWELGEGNLPRLPDYPPERESNMPIKLHIRRHTEADATFEIPDGASVVISANGDKELK